MYFYILVIIMSVFEYERDAIRVKARLRSNTDDTETVSINSSNEFMIEGHRRVLLFDLVVRPVRKHKLMLHCLPLPTFYYFSR